MVTVGVVIVVATAMTPEAPPSQLWHRWEAHDPTSTRTIDHRAWEAFLTRYLRIGADGVHRVAYSRVTAPDRAALDAYIAELAGLPISGYNRAEQLAYWINLYNALVVRADPRPLPDRQHPRHRPRRRRAARGPWDEKLVEVEGQPVSLSDIQNRILRPIWHDPRVLYALSCGAVSCPNLQPEPYQADRLEHQLSKAAMVYVNDPRCIQIDGNRLSVSSLYRWYAADFGGSDTRHHQPSHGLRRAQARDVPRAVRADQRRRLRLAPERRHASVWRPSPPTPGRQPAVRSALPAYNDGRWPNRCICRRRTGRCRRACSC